MFAELVATLLVVQAVIVSSAGSATAATNTAVDFGSVLMTTDPFAIGIGSSTYGATPLSSGAQNDVERRLDARYVRVPVGIRDGQVASSAYGSGLRNVVPLVNTYRSWGFRVLAVIGGRTNDFDVQPGDATRIITALGLDGIDYSAPNEPNNMGLSVWSEIEVARMIVSEGRAIDPNFRLLGPVWSYYDRNEIGTFARHMGSSLGGVDYHHYGMGHVSLSTADVLARTPDRGREVAEMRGDLGAAGLSRTVVVDEVNLSWRYDDGTPTSDGGDGSGRNNRFFTAINTVFVASVCGHVLQEGGRCLPYATQNGPLGMTVEAGQANPDHRPDSSPMPGYWGIAAWTGAGLWPHMKDTFYRTSSPDPSVEVFAVSNEAGGANLVVINKSEWNGKQVSVGLTGAAAGSFRLYQSNPRAQYDAPALTGSGGFTDSIDIWAPAMTVSVAVLSPGGAAPSTYRIAAGDGSVPGYGAPGDLVAGGTAAANPGTTVPPAGVPAELFSTERWGRQTYTLPVPPGRSVRLGLLFAERYPPAQQDGARRFNVTINGVRWITELDIWARQGRTTSGSVLVSTVVAPADGVVRIELTDGSAGAPTINGILIDPE